jgi:hypothetical protein
VPHSQDTYSPELQAMPLIICCRHGLTPIFLQFRALMHTLLAQSISTHVLLVSSKKAEEDYPTQPPPFKGQRVVVASVEALCLAHSITRTKTFIGPIRRVVGRKYSHNDLLRVSRGMVYLTSMVKPVCFA